MHARQAGTGRGGPYGGSQPASWTEGPCRVSKKQGGRRRGAPRPSNIALAAAMAYCPDSTALLTWARSAGDLAASNAWSARSRYSYALVYWLTACGLPASWAWRSTLRLRRSSASASRSSWAAALTSANWAPLRIVRCSDRFSRVRASSTATVTTPATVSRTSSRVLPSAPSWPGGGCEGGAVAGEVPAASSTLETKSMVAAASSGCRRNAVLARLAATPGSRVLLAAPSSAPATTRYVPGLPTEAATVVARSLALPPASASAWVGRMATNTGVPARASRAEIRSRSGGDRVGLADVFTYSGSSRSCPAVRSTHGPAAAAGLARTASRHSASPARATRARAGRASTARGVPRGNLTPRVGDLRPFSRFWRWGVTPPRRRAGPPGRAPPAMRPSWRRPAG